MNRAGRAGASAVLLVTLAGCSAAGAEGGGGDSPSSVQGTDAAKDSSPAEAQPESSGVVREVPFNDTTIKVTVHPIEVQGEQALLTVDYTAEAGSELPPLSGILNGAVHLGANGAIGMRLVDPEALKVYPVLESGSGDYLASGVKGLEPGTGTRTSTSVHTAPEGDDVDVMIPLLGYVPDVPVTQAGDGFDAAVAEFESPGDPAVYPLRSFTSGYDDAASVESEGKNVTVNLKSDVLFDSSEFALDAGAKKVVKKAAEKIGASADGGEVRVVGHTDDVDSDAFNQKLSQKRAASVSEQLGSALGGAYKVTSEGRGESEPVVAETSKEARAANRRVEIVFDGTKEQADTSTDASIPRATGDTVAADDTVEFQRYKGDPDTYTLGVKSVERRGQALVGTLELGLVDGDGSVISTLGEPDVFDAAERGFVITSAYSAPLDVALLGQEGRTFALDYEETPDEGSDEPRRRLLADEQVNQGAQTPGSTVLVEVVWPDTGEDEVTVDIPDRARFEDVPVTDGAGSD